MRLLLEKITRKTARVAVVGVGYVGTALAQAAVNAGFATVGIDIDPTRVKKINSAKQAHLTATSDFGVIKSCDVIAVCVPTPLNRKNAPDLSLLTAAVRQAAVHLTKDQLVTIESSLAPGTTRHLVLPIIQKSGSKVGQDIYLAHSPERIDPGNTSYPMRRIPKVVGGVNAVSEMMALAFYGELVDTIVPVSSLEAAEFTKVLENTFRLVNISFVNELLPYAQKTGVDLWEVVEAAGTKPFGFLPHYPGPGAGGYCIPVLPRYLLDSARKLGVDLRLVETAVRVNETQPQKVAQKTREILNMNGNNGISKALLVGVAYKKDLSDSRYSTSLTVWTELEKMGITVSFHDPYAPFINGFTSVPLNQTTLRNQDIAIITTAHSSIDYTLLVSCGIPVLDTRNALKGIKGKQIYRL